MINGHKNTCDEVLLVVTKCGQVPLSIATAVSAATRSEVAAALFFLSLVLAAVALSAAGASTNTALLLAYASIPFVYYTLGVLTFVAVAYIYGVVNQRLSKRWFRRVYSLPIAIALSILIIAVMSIARENVTGQPTNLFRFWAFVLLLSGIGETFMAIAVSVVLVGGGTVQTTVEADPAVEIEEAEDGTAEATQPGVVMCIRDVTILASELMYLEASGNYVNVVCKDRTAFVRGPLHDVLGDVSCIDGLQIHRSVWIALRECKGFERDGERVIVIATNGQRLKVARGRRNEVIAAIESYQRTPPTI